MMPTTKDNCKQEAHIIQTLTLEGNL